MKASRRSSAPPDVPTLFAQWKNGIKLSIIVFFWSRGNHCIFLDILVEQAVLTLHNVAETVQVGDEHSEPPSDFGSEPSSPPESDSEPESDPPEDFDETPPESDFDDEPSTEPNSFMDESFIDSIIDDSIMEGSFIEDDDGILNCLPKAYQSLPSYQCNVKYYILISSINRQLDLAKHEYWHDAALYGWGR